MSNQGSTPKKILSVLDLGMTLSTVESMVHNIIVAEQVAYVPSFNHRRNTSRLLEYVPGIVLDEGEAIEPVPSHPWYPLVS